MRNLFALLFCPFTLVAAGCANCHPTESKLHAASAHAHALMLPPESAFARNLPDHPLGEAANGYTFSYSRPPGQLEVTVQRGNERIVAPLVWMFGSGRQGQTPIIKYHGRFFEHRVSLYQAGGYGITIGQENGVSPNAQKALGWQQTAAEARACFNCHATVADLSANLLAPGIECVRCHAGADEHAAGRGLPVNPAKLDHVAEVRLCGECHRTEPPSPTADQVGNVRFQPLRLMRSACFRKSNLSCATCHAAHRDAVRSDPAYYNRACLNCHSKPIAHSVRLRSENCIACHMPKVSPAPSLTFTDHFIRIADSTQ